MFNDLALFTDVYRGMNRGLYEFHFSGNSQGGAADHDNKAEQSARSVIGSVVGGKHKPSKNQRKPSAGKCPTCTVLMP